jgi:hypothetical protein
MYDSNKTFEQGTVEEERIHARAAFCREEVFIRGRKELSLTSKRMHLRAYEQSSGVVAEIDTQIGTVDIMVNPKPGATSNYLTMMIRRLG